MRGIDPLRVVICLSGFASPCLRARLDFRRRRLGSDFAPRVAGELVRAGDVVVDHGALWGTHPCVVARAVGPTGLVHAFDLNRQHCRALRAIPGAARNVDVHSFAPSDEAGSAALHIRLVERPSDALASLGHPLGAHPQIERRPLVDLNFERIDFIKCDVGARTRRASRWRSDATPAFGPAGVDLPRLLTAEPTPATR